MRYSFHVSKHRYDELKQFIRTQMPTARFEYNPYPLVNLKTWQVSITLEIEDIGKLNDLENKWYLEDNSEPIIDNRSKIKQLIDQVTEWFKV